MPPQQQAQTKYRSKNVFLVKKEWYQPRYGPYSMRYEKQVRAFEFKPDAESFVELENSECQYCQRKKAMRTRYWIEPQMLHVRLRND